MRFAKIMATLLCTAAGTSAAFAQSGPLPWGQSPDMLAWQVFTQIAAPTGVPGSKGVMFESWASDSDIYVPAGQQPHWPGIDAPKRLQPSLLAVALNAGKPGPHVIAPGDCQPPNDPQAGNFPANQCIGEEVRRNWSSYQYIVSNKLWSTDGLKQAFADKLDVDLPADAIEVKGDWAKVDVVRDWINTTIKPNPPLTTADVRKLYHVNNASDGQEYALLGLAISSKQVKDWLWATWEHQLSPGRCDDIGCRDDFGAADADVKPRNVNGGAPNQYYGKCERSKAGKALLDAAGLASVWENYCLKGAQFTFTEQSQPTRLGNSVVERINAGVPILKSSCVTCHAYAGFANDGTPNNPFEDIGDPNPAHLQGIRQNDFLWGVLFAK